MAKLLVKKVVIFKHGVSYFILEGAAKGSETFELEFKIDEMDDILKSLFVLDTSEKGYISSISYDAALDTAQLLKSIMLNIPDTESFSSLVTQIKGAHVSLTLSGSEKVTGIIMGIETIERAHKETIITEKLLTLLKDNNIVTKIPFAEINNFDILSEELKKDLKFFLDTVIAGKKKDAKKIAIHCESGGKDSIERKVVVSFIRESPVWKTSYRLIMSKQQAQEKKCLLSGWCMVENTTNEDWDEIQLSLVAGMPVSFKYEFYRPIFMIRPRIEPPKVLSAKPAEIEDAMETESFMELEADEEKETTTGRRDKGKMAKKKESVRAAAPCPPPKAVAASTLAGLMSVSDQDIAGKMRAQTAAQTKDLGELFEYNISKPVTIKRKQSALVPILTEEIKARRILLYNKNEHDKNPNACLEITNNTVLTLERGPVTIVYDNNLAGEAIIPFLNKDDTRLLNYAVEQAVIITHEEKSENTSVHRVSFGGSYAYEYYFTNKSTNYKIKNKTAEEKILYLDHPKEAEYKFTEKPIEPEETPNYWRFTITLKPKDAISLTLKERRENYASYYLWNWSKDDILKKVSYYITNKFINERFEKKLNDLATLIGKANEVRDKKSKLENDRNLMTQEQNRLRENIRALGTTTQEMSLREKYVKKLSEQENLYETMKAEIEQLDKDLTVLNGQIDFKVNNLK